MSEVEVAESIILLPHSLFLIFTFSGSLMVKPAFLAISACTLYLINLYNKDLPISVPGKLESRGYLPVHHTY